MVYSFRILTLFICLTFLYACNPGSGNKRDAALFYELIQSSENLKPDQQRIIVSRLDSIKNHTGMESIHDTLYVKYLMLTTSVVSATVSADSAIRFLENCYYKQLPAPFLRSRIYAGLKLTEFYIDYGKIEQAKQTLNEVSAWINEADMAFERAWYLNEAGLLNTNQGNYTEAQGLILKSLFLFDSIGDLAGKTAACQNLATNYHYLGEMDLALLYGKKAVELANIQSDSVKIQSVLINLGITYSAIEPDSAAYYFSKAAGFTNNHRVTIESLAAAFHLAGLDYERKKYREAENLYTEILNASEKEKIPSGIYRALSGLGNVYEALGKDKQALETFAEAAKVSNDCGDQFTFIKLLEAEYYMLNKMGLNTEAEQKTTEIKQAKQKLALSEQRSAVRMLERRFSESIEENYKKQLRDVSEEYNLISGFQRSMLTWGMVLMTLMVGAFLFFYYRYRSRERKILARLEEFRNDPRLSRSMISPLGEKPDSPKVNDGQADPFFAKINAFFITEQPYLNPELKTEDIALRLRISQKVITQAIKTNTGYNFNGYVNNFRIQEALRLLSDPERRQYKIEAIAREAGFGSKGNFYSVFTAVTGSKPSEYR